MKRRIVYPIVVILMSICLPVCLDAQVVDPPADPQDVPIDGGLSILLAAGVGYGIKKVRDSRKGQKKSDGSSI